MALPKAAQRQVEEANRLIAAMSGKEPEQPEQKDPELQVVEPPVVEEPPAEPPVEQVVTDQGTPAEPPPAEQPPAEDFEHKYNVLQGKYDKEVPRMRREMQQLTEELDNMRSLLAQMQDTKPEPATFEASKLVTDEEIEEYGSDLIDLVGRRAKEVYEPVVNELKSEVESLKQQLGGVSKTVGANSRDRLLAQLDKRVEDWQELNTSPEFLDWLDEVDPYSGDQRGRMLRAAFQKNDTERVIAFFNGFKNEHAVVSPPSATDSGVEEETSTPGTPAVDLESLAAPGKASRKPGTPTSTQEPKRVWTRRQISEFYKDVQLGKYKSDEQKQIQKAIERDIIRATTEGRIRD